MEPSHPEQSGWEQTRGPGGLETKRGASENGMAQGWPCPSRLDREVLSGV